MFYLILRQKPKEKLYDEFQTILDEGDNTVCMFYIIKALIIRGEKNGF